jgi:hypothetical protein
MFAEISTYSSCYDLADKLTSTSEPGYTGTIAYDTHGNATTIAGETHSYDATDRHHGERHDDSHLPA